MRRILLVDDDPLVRIMLSDALTNDYKIETAASGEEAMRLLERTTHGRPQFDLIITDLNMGAVNGFELASYVKGRNAHNKFTPVILLSSEEVTKEQARQHGCAAYLPKTNLKKIVSMTHILLPRTGSSPSSAYPATLPL